MKAAANIIEVYMGYGSRIMRDPTAQHNHTHEFLGDRRHSKVVDKFEFAKYHIESDGIYIRKQTEGSYRVVGGVQ
jgi:hypothetical protein